MHLSLGLWEMTDLKEEVRCRRWSMVQETKTERSHTRDSQPLNTTLAAKLEKSRGDKTQVKQMTRRASNKRESEGREHMEETLSPTLV